MDFYILLQCIMFYIPFVR